jgi:hypothetical protein
VLHSKKEPIVDTVMVIVRVIMGMSMSDKESSVNKRHDSKAMQSLKATYQQQMMLDASRRQECNDCEDAAC